MVVYYCHCIFRNYKSLANRLDSNYRLKPSSKASSAYQNFRRERLVLFYMIYSYLLDIANSNFFSFFFLLNPGPCIPYALYSYLISNMRVT